MTDKEIYKLWLSNVQGPKYFRSQRWAGLREFIIKNKIASVLEFGAGISSILFTNLGLRLVSYETDPKYLKIVRSLCSKGEFHIWNNDESAPIPGRFDLAFVDGILPRIPQLKLAFQHATYVAIDDYGPRMKNIFKELIAERPRLDSRTTLVAIFKS